MQMRRFSLVMVLAAATGVLLWGVFGPAYAAPRTQPSDPLRYGDTVSGEITEADACRYYTFSGSAGDPVIIEIDCHEGRRHLPTIRARRAA